MREIFLLVAKEICKVLFVSICRFIAAVTALTLNLTILSSFVFLLFFCRFPFTYLGKIFSLRRLVTNFDVAIDGLIHLHSRNLRFILVRICGVELSCHLPESLSSARSYVMVINHRSQADILVILATFYDKIPDVKFFLKSSLFWVPFLGQFCYLMNYVFVKRISARQVRRNPLVIQNQRELIRQQCRQLIKNPVTLAVFAEGTRFSISDHKTHLSGRNLAHLLSPQPAGVALALEASSPDIEDFIDVTLAYDVGFVSVWLLLSGQVKTIEIHAELHNVSTAKLVGDYVNDRQYRKRFTGWVRRLWAKKDALLSRIYQRFSSKNYL